MTPGFALSLSIEGIELLSRAAGGWRVAGRATLDADELTAELADLRERAVALGDPAFRTKLIIPNDQIRYLSVDTGHVATADRIAQVREALDGATPYPVEDLVYDVCVDGPMTHVAAVARDTLEEAEAFALEHRFNPVSFVAVPGDAAFLGEPFFGPTAFSEKALAPGERVEPDGIAVVVIGEVEFAVPNESEKLSKPETLHIEPVSEPEELAPLETAPVDHAVPPEEPPISPSVAGEAPAPGFSSRRANAAPPLGGASRSTISPRIEDDEEPPPAPDPAALSASFDAPDLPDEPETEPTEPAQSWAARFLSRRADSAEDPAPDGAPAGKIPPAPPPHRAPAMASAAPDVSLDESADERTRMTIFGMREASEVGGSPRHLGLILTAILLLFLAGVAAWAALFLDDGIASLFDRDEPVQAAQVPAPEPPAPEQPLQPDGLIETATLEPEVSGLSDTDAAVLDALRPEPATEQEPELAQPEEAIPTEEEIASNYAVTGIWQQPPTTPAEPGLIGLDDLYITSIDAAVDARDAIALPAPDAFETDQALGQVISPAAPDAQFAFDENGRVIPTPEGALSPDGFTVYLGTPPLVPPPTPQRSEAEVETETVAALTPDLRPRARPVDLVEQSERSQLGGLTLSELSGVRPRPRPQVEKREDEADETPTAQAVQASQTPRLRPVNMAQLVAATRNAQQRSSQGPVAAAPEEAAAPQTVAATTVTPRIPSSASVSRAATVNNAINLRKVNLIGVYGTSANRRALVRLPNGRYRKVEVGDRLDGGRISAIGESELRYQKGGRNVVLRIPSG